MSESETAGIRLPGIELNYPTTWQGTIAVIAVCTMVTVVLHTVVSKVERGTVSNQSIQYIISTKCS